MCVNVKEKILRGQPLIFSSKETVPIHAPTSGFIEDIVILSDSNNKKKICIILQSDQKDSWITLYPIKNYKNYSAYQLIHIIHELGIVGLGGGQFSSAKKLQLSEKKVNTLIVNAIESEPYITADKYLLSNYLKEIIIGCEIIIWISCIKKVLIAVSEENLELIMYIKDFISNKSLFELCILKNKYPGGSSKILIKALTGKDIPAGKHSIDIGYLMFNVATIYAIKRAIINGEPLTERIVTCLGKKNILSGNYWIRIGTPISYFIKDPFLHLSLDIIIYLGGGIMGHIVSNIDSSILKNKNCIIVFSKKTLILKNIEYPCIRCGKCVNVCPVNLLPQQLYWYSKNKDHLKTKEHYIFDCIECKACEIVCPSKIPLVKYFHIEKKIQNQITYSNIRKQESLIRFKMREQRLLEEINQKKNILIQNTVNQLMRKKQIKEAIKRMQNKK